MAKLRDAVDGLCRKFWHSVLNLLCDASGWSNFRWARIAAWTGYIGVCSTLILIGVLIIEESPPTGVFFIVLTLYMMWRLVQLLEAIELIEEMAEVGLDSIPITFPGAVRIVRRRIWLGYWALFFLVLGDPLTAFFFAAAMAANYFMLDYRPASPSKALAWIREHTTIHAHGRSAA